MGSILGGLGDMVFGGYLEKQLVIPSGDLPGVAASMRAFLLEDQADPGLQNLTDAQMLSLAKAADKAIIKWGAKKAGL